jgi:hypothetical protein
MPEASRPSLRALAGELGTSHQLLSFVLGVLETLQHLNWLTSYGVGYRSFTEQYFDSCDIFKGAVIEPPCQ